jgi:hypothetical protein
MHLRICGSFKSTKTIGSSNLKSANRKNIWSTNCKFANCHICGSSENYYLIKSANLQICDLRNLFADRPPLIGVLLMVCFGVCGTGWSAVGEWFRRYHGMLLKGSDGIPYSMRLPSSWTPVGLILGGLYVVLLMVARNKS